MGKAINRQNQLIAPCGMNCSICIAYMRDKNKCAGCHSENGFKPTHCTVCSIKNCESLKLSPSGFCYDCPQYPCRRLQQLDKRYRTNYHMSMLENLQMIRESGMEAFLQNEKIKWTCPNCRAGLSAHRDVCPECGAAVAFVD